MRFHNVLHFNTTLPTLGHNAGAKFFVSSKREGLAGYFMKSSIFATGTEGFKLIRLSTACEYNLCKDMFKYWQPHILINCKETKELQNAKWQNLLSGAPCIYFVEHVAYYTLSLRQFLRPKLLNSIDGGCQNTFHTEICAHFIS